MKHASGVVTHERTARLPVGTVQGRNGMRLGAVFPQNEIGDDPSVIRTWAEEVERLGYQHILAYDHVIGAGVDTRPDWRGYTSESAFHEVFVLFGYLAAVTTTIELVTGVLILPQRQTALVAKQAAEVDVLSGGRLRLGVGVGWNPVEYDVLNESFRDRGVRSEEQIDLLRALWADPTIDYTGRWHRVDNAGIKPRPSRRRIPVWLGGNAEAVLRRAGPDRRRLAAAAGAGRRGCRDARPGARLRGGGRAFAGRRGLRGPAEPGRRTPRHVGRVPDRVAGSRCHAPLRQHHGPWPDRREGSRRGTARGVRRPRGRELKTVSSGQPGGS
jgi:probable F420-dependent oxidoreductase